MLPRSSGLAIRVEHDVGPIGCGRALARNESASREVVGSRQSGLTRTDHDDVDERGIHIQTERLSPRPDSRAASWTSSAAVRLVAGRPERHVAGDFNARTAVSTRAIG